MEFSHCPMWEGLEVRRLLSASTSHIASSLIAHPASTVQPAMNYALSVTAQTDIYGAGKATPPDSAEGVSPVAISFAAASREQFTFPSITGSINYNVPDSNGPNGDEGDSANGAQSTNFSAVGSLSGYSDLSNFFGLLGVFTSPGSSDQAPPAGLSDDQVPTFTLLRPKLNQVFFVGNGSTTSGTVRTYIVPPGATKLYLGFADHYFPDNTGIVTVTAVASVPPVYVPDIPAQTITDAPAMPVIPVTLNITDGYTLVGGFKYVATVTYSVAGQHERYVLRGSANAPAFDVQFPAGIIRGGNFSIQFTASIENDLTGIATGYKLSGLTTITGENPTSADLATAFAGQSDLQAIAYEESGLTQFSTAGLPEITKPKSFGMFMLNSKVTAEQLWDWQANLTAGSQLYAHKEAVLTAYYDKLSHVAKAPALTDEQLRLAFLQNYAGGIYWLWSRIHKTWVKNPGLKLPVFGENAITYAEQLDTAN